MDIYKNREYSFFMGDFVPLHSLINLKQLVFEVTSSCNLKCKYCGYGELYNTRRDHTGRHMSFTIAKTMIDYLFELWMDNIPDFPQKKTFVGFYGGEPLLNMKLIKKIITYIESMPLPPQRSFCYTMTTNAVLLDRYIDFLVDKEFNLLISLDGNQYAHSYRVNNNGKNSFQQVFDNVMLLKDKYPEYFSKHVSFNSVLTNRGESFSVKEFVFDHFGKYPQISEVNNFGVISEKKNYLIRFQDLSEPIGKIKKTMQLKMFFFQNLQT